MIKLLARMGGLIWRFNWRRICFWMFSFWQHLVPVKWFLERWGPQFPVGYCLEAISYGPLPHGNFFIKLRKLREQCWESPNNTKVTIFVIWCSIPQCCYSLLVRIITKGDRINKAVNTRKWEVLGGHLQVCLPQSSWQNMKTHKLQYISIILLSRTIKTALSIPIIS